MNSKFIVGVGNIYANEALFRAKIKPNRQAGRISLKRYEKLSKELPTYQVLPNELPTHGNSFH